MTLRKTKKMRKMKQANLGKERKRKACNEGTTPPFPIHPDKEKKSDEKE